jgi:hypothetical protein
LTLLISGAIAALFLTVIGLKMYRIQKNPALQSEPTAGNSWRFITIAVGIVTLLSVVSLFDLPGVRSFFGHIPNAIYPCHGYAAPMIFMMYSFFTALAIICLLSADHWRQPAFFLPIITLPLILWGHEISCEGYLPFGAPVVVPVAMTLLERIGLVRNTVPLASIAGLLIVLAHSISTNPGYPAPTFQALPAFPADSKFAGLRAHPEFVAYADEMLKDVSPRIRGHETLWVCLGGPHLAWGGKPVFSPATMCGDTYNARSEEVFYNRWQRQPPQFVYVYNPNPCFGSRLLTKDGLNRWLPAQYRLAWKSSQRDATLWELRPQSSGNNTH